MAAQRATSPCFQWSHIAEGHVFLEAQCAAQCMAHCTAHCMSQRVEAAFPEPSLVTPPLSFLDCYVAAGFLGAPAGTGGPPSTSLAMRASAALSTDVAPVGPPRELFTHLPIGGGCFSHPITITLPARGQEELFPLLCCCVSFLVVAGDSFWCYLEYQLCHCVSFWL
jgi:hypothetical protein